MLLLAGTTGIDGQGKVTAPGDIVAQFDKAIDNIVALIRHAGGEPQDVVRLRIFVTDAGAYREHLKELGKVWQKYFGKYYPAMMLVECTALWDPECMVEIEGEVLLPDGKPARET